MRIHRAFALSVLLGLGASFPAAASDPLPGTGLWLESGKSSDIRPPGFPPKDISPRFVPPVPGHVFRVAYLVPTNRTAQPKAVASLRHAMLQYQAWYRDQMQRNGFGAKTFVLETEADGKTPRIHVLTVNTSDEHLRGDIWGRTIEAAGAAGVPIWIPKQVWLLIPECHVQSPNGAISGGTALGASFGSDDDPGVGMLGSDSLFRFDPAALTNDTAYAGKIVPEIGPYPLVQNVSFPWFEGTTFSSISSSSLGAGLHELTHGLGQPHDFRNDDNFRGNLMGNGLRGFRGALLPERYPDDYTRIGYGVALMLSVNRYLNDGKTYTDNTKPAVNIFTSGTNTPVNGLLQVRFTCSDAGGLYAAFLSLNGDLVDEMKLSGTSANTLFATPYYTPGQSDRFAVTVIDLQGNRQTVENSIIPQPGFNRAPQPFVTLDLPTAFVGQTVTLSASRSFDPDGGSANLKVEWDLDGDGAFDTSPNSNLWLPTTFSTAGDRLVRARLSDSAGAQSLSTPLPVRISLPALTITKTGDIVTVAWPSAATDFILESTDSTLVNWHPVALPPVIVNGQHTLSLTNPPGSAFFQLRR